MAKSTYIDKHGVKFHLKELPFHHPHRMKRDVHECLADAAMVFTIGYTIAMHLEHILRVLDENELMWLLEENLSIRDLGKIEELEGSGNLVTP